MEITTKIHGFSPLLMPPMLLLGFMGTPAWAATGTASDTFPTIAYNGSDGTLPWAGAWQEFGEPATAPVTNTGVVRVLANSTTAGVTNCVASNCLRIGGNQVAIQNRGVQRQIDLSGATSATLNFTYRRVRPSSTRTVGLGLVRAEVSSDGGANWQTLASFPFTTSSDPNRTQASFDITSAASANTRIRFIGQATDNLGNPTTNATYVNYSVGLFYVDDVKIDVVKPDVPPPPPSTGLSVGDSFAAVAYNGSDGAAPNTNPGPWTSPWTETGETGTAAGPTAGQVRVVTNANCAAAGCLRIGGNGSANINNRGAARAVNLNGAATARLSFVYKRVINSPPTGSGSVLVQASPNGSTWTTLSTIPFGAASDVSHISANFDIKPYAAAGTQIRFLGQGTTANGLLHVDNVKVEWTANNPPAAANDSYTTAQNTALSIAAPGVLANDADPEGGALTAVVGTGPAHGTLTLNPDGSFLYTPAAGYSGADSFTYTANDGSNDSPATTVAIDVTPPTNQPPAFNPTSYSFTVNQTAASGAAIGGVAATDPEGQAVAYAITAGNTGNALAIDPSSGAITVAGPLTAGTANLTVRATDAGGASAEVQVAVTVAEVSVNLKVLVISTGPAATDPLNMYGPNTSDGVLGYMQRFLEQAGVPYDVLDASAPGRAPLTSADLTVSASHGRYNGIILTDTTVGGLFASSEWAALHGYERDFKVREAVLSGWPAYSWNPTTGCVSPTFSNCDYDYGMADGSWSNNVNPANTTTTLPVQVQWNSGDPRFAYVVKSNPWTITDFAWYATPRNDAAVTATPLLTEPGTGKALISRLAYADGRQVLLSSIGNAWFLLYSEVLAREFVDFATQGVFIGESKPYLNLHVDDLFLGDNLWDPVSNWTSAEQFERLAGAEIPNVAAAQNAFKTAHPLAQEVKLEFAFNGVGLGPDGLAANPSDPLVPVCTGLIVSAFGSPTPPPGDLADSMAQVQSAQANFDFINHTYTHLDLDFSGHQDAAGTGPGTSTNTDYQNEIDCNRLVWRNLGLPGYAENFNTLLTGEHSGIKDDGLHNAATEQYCYADSYLGSHCVAEANAPFPEPPLNVLLNDSTKAFPYAGNPRFFETAQGLGVRYLAGDASQVNQGVDQFVRHVPSNRNGAGSTLLDFDLLLLPRYPTAIFYNAWYPGALVDCSATPANANCQPGSLVDEYNNLFRERPLAQNGGVDYCVGGIAQPPYQGAICAPRDYATILAADADITVRHMLGWQKYPHFFHEINLKNYDGAGSTLLFDWANAVMGIYESYVNLPVKSLPYWKVGQLAEERLKAHTAGITGVWNITAGTVSLQAATAAKAIVTGVAGSEPLYGGQSVQTIGVGPSAVTVPVYVP